MNQEKNFYKLGGFNMSLGLGLAIGGIAIGIGLYLVARAIDNGNGIKSHEMFLKQFHYMD